MNAAAKAINQSNLFTGQLFDIQLSRLLRFNLWILMIFLLSSLAVIYVTNEYRTHFSQLQQLERAHQKLLLQRGQLLLEQASLATPARVEDLATQKLKMHLPDNKNVIMLEHHE